MPGEPKFERFALAIYIYPLRTNRQRLRLADSGIDSGREPVGVVEGKGLDDRRSRRPVDRHIR